MGQGASQGARALRRTPVRKGGVQEWAEREVQTQLRPPASPPESSRAALQTWPQMEARQIEASPTRGGPQRRQGGLRPRVCCSPFQILDQRGRGRSSGKTAWPGLETSALRTGRSASGDHRPLTLIPNFTSSAVAFEQIVQRMRSGRRVWAAGEPWDREWVPEEQCRLPTSPSKRR